MRALPKRILLIIRIVVWLCMGACLLLYAYAELCGYNKLELLFVKIGVPLNLSQFMLISWLLAAASIALLCAKPRSE